ncbi:MAG: hypothetical protein V4662_00375 [Verrucomicrobiota bacterium]
MKSFLHASLILLATSAATLKANPEIPLAVAQSFGENVADNLVLVKGTSTTSEPVEWTAYARDAFRPEEILRISVKMEATLWKAVPAGAGTKILTAQPAKTINAKRLRVRSAEARVVAAKAAALAQTTFVTVDYQLAANTETGVPEWGMALKDDTGYEVGFCVVSAETGALSFQDWTPRFATAPATPPSEGEQAAKTVKKGVRKAWNWTDKARSETRNFFRELFR